MRVADNKIDQAIVEYVGRKQGWEIGERNDEEIKIKIGSEMLVDEEESIEVKGRDMIQGLTRSISVSTNEVVEAIQDELREIVRAVRVVLQETPPELASDIMDKGMVLTGGSSLLRNLDRMISQAVGVPAYVAEDAILCVAKGTGIALDNLDSYKKSILSAR